PILDPAHSLRCLLLYLFNAPATTETYTLSLHDALPISEPNSICSIPTSGFPDLLRSKTTIDSLSFSLISADTYRTQLLLLHCPLDRKSTRLNSSHVKISYAVFCLKKKKKNQEQRIVHYT